MPKGIYDRKASPKAMAHLKKLAFKPGHIVPDAIREQWSQRRVGAGNPMWGRKRTSEEKRLMSIRRRGLTARDKNPNWRGGKSTIAHVIRTHPQYERWRKSIMERDNYTCQICLKRGGDLEVDHYPKTFKDIMNEFSIKSIEDAVACEALWNKENNRTLCVFCHRGGK